MLETVVDLGICKVRQTPQCFMCNVHVLLALYAVVGVWSMGLSYSCHLVSINQMVYVGMAWVKCHMICGEIYLSWEEHHVYVNRA